mmetsp:Transcript_69489/g.85212  ORF Transcript_69489/g.85212 Transcript_69489/m.85212 type:complete len:249 (+) Transcript_69489:149-895(+)
MQIEHLLGGSKDLLVDFINLLIRWVLHFGNFNDSAKGHRHLDAPGDGEAKATPVQEDGGLRLPGNGLQDAPGIIPAGESCRVAEGVSRDNGSSRPQSQPCDAFPFLHGHEFLVATGLENSSNTIGDNANTTALLNRLLNGMTVHWYHAIQGHVSKHWRVEHNAGSPSNKGAAQKCVDGWDAQQVSEWENSVGWASADPGGFLKRGIGRIIAPNKTIREVLEENQGEVRLDKHLVKGFSWKRMKCKHSS